MRCAEAASALALALGGWGPAAAIVSGKSTRLGCFAVGGLPRQLAEAPVARQTHLRACPSSNLSRILAVALLPGVSPSPSSGRSAEARHGRRRLEVGYAGVMPHAAAVPPFISACQCRRAARAWASSCCAQS